MIDWDAIKDQVLEAFQSAQQKEDDDAQSALANELLADHDALMQLQERWWRFRRAAPYKELLLVLEQEATLIADAARSSSRRQAKLEIEKLRGERRGREQEIFECILFAVDYTKQERLFRRASALPTVRDERVWGVAISGTADDGLYWLCKRLQNHVELPSAPGEASSDSHLVIRYSFQTAAFEQSVPTLFKIVAEELDMPDLDPKEADVLDKLCDEWQRKNVFFVISGIDRLGPPMWEALTQRFWRPLVEHARKRRHPQGITEMIGFFLLGGGWQPQAGTVATQLDEGFGPETPLLLPALGPFDGAMLKEWFEDHGADLPLPKGLGSLEAAIQAFASGGSARDVFKALCRVCEYKFSNDLWPL